MDGKIKMPEALAKRLSEDEAEMRFFDSLSLEEKKEYIKKRELFQNQFS